MSSLKEKIISTIEKDFDLLAGLQEIKMKRKESSLLLKRIESSRKLLADDTELIEKLNELETRIKNLI